MYNTLKFCTNILILIARKCMIKTLKTVKLDLLDCLYVSTLLDEE